MIVVETPLLLPKKELSSSEKYLNPYSIDTSPPYNTFKQEKHMMSRKYIPQKKRTSDI